MQSTSDIEQMMDDRASRASSPTEEIDADLAQAQVEAMQEYVEETFPYRERWGGQLDSQEDYYSDGVMTSFRMVTLPNIGEVLFKFVEDGAWSCCVVDPDEAVFIVYNMEQLTDLIAEITSPSYVPGRAGIPDAMLIDFQPQPGDQCPICLEEADEDDGARAWVSLPLCAHRFHGDCIRRWPCATCPTCRAVHRV